MKALRDQFLVGAIAGCFGAGAWTAAREGKFIEAAISFAIGILASAWSARLECGK